MKSEKYCKNYIFKFIPKHLNEEFQGKPRRLSKFRPNSLEKVTERQDRRKSRFNTPAVIKEDVDSIFNLTTTKNKDLRNEINSINSNSETLGSFESGLIKLQKINILSPGIKKSVIINTTKKPPIPKAVKFQQKRGSIRKSVNNGFTHLTDL